MKKLWFLGIVVVLALAITACNDVLTEPESGVMPVITGQTEDGRAIMELSIGGGIKTKALTDAFAKNRTDYYEAAFFDGTNVYRTTWGWADNGKIRIPVGDYTGAEKAILFAGRESDKTLLGVGIITAVNGTPETTVNVDTSTTSITFTLYPLLNSIDDTASSTFQITGLTYPLTLKDNSVPIHPLAKNTLATTPTDIITSTYKIDIGTGGAQTATHYKGMFIGTPDPLSVVHISNANKDDLVPMLPMENKTITTDNTGADIDKFPSDGIFNLGFDTPDVDGYSKLALKIPVYAINTLSPLVEWNIQGGLTNGIFDKGVTANSLGGAILLLTGTAPTEWVDVSLFGVSAP